MPGSVNGTASQIIQPGSIWSRGIESNAGVTGRAPFIDQLAQGKNDPISMFKQNPHQTNKAFDLVYHEAQKNLPADFLSKELSTEGGNIRNLIGIIYSDVKNSGDKQDIAILNAVCKRLGDANGIEKKEQVVQKLLSGLVSKYSTASFEKVINKYIEHCMGAWEDHHQAKSVDVENKAIFKEDLEACKTLLRHKVTELTKPDQPWEMMAQNMKFFSSSCAAISKTLINYDAPEANSPENTPPALNIGPEGGADKQRLFIPTGPGQGGITLNITSAGGAGGSVGNITHSVGTTAAELTDSTSAIAKHILDSGLKDVDKIGLINNLIELNAGKQGSNFLNNLTGVQGFKPEQSFLTQHLGVDKQKVATQTDAQGVQDTAIGTEGMVESDTPKSLAPMLATEHKINEPVATPLTDVESDLSVQKEYVGTISVDTLKRDIAFVAGQSRVSPSYSEKLIKGGEPDDGPSIDEQQTQASQGDNLYEVTLRRDRPKSDQTPAVGGEPVYTTARTFDPLNRRSSIQKHFVPTGSGPERDKPDSKNVTLESQFERLTKRDPSVFDHLEKNGSTLSQNMTLQQVADHDAEEPVVSSLTPSDRNSQSNIDSPLAASSTVSQQMVTSPGDKPDGVTLQKSNEQSDRKSANDSFKPFKVTPKVVSRGGNTTADHRVFTTRRTVDMWNRDSAPKHFLPAGAESNPDELESKFAATNQRDLSAFDHFEKKTVEQPRKVFPFQEKLAEFKTKGKAIGN